MGVTGHFGTENYVCKVGIIQNLCEYCRLFLFDFCAQTISIPPIYTLLITINFFWKRKQRGRHEETTCQLE